MTIQKRLADLERRLAGAGDVVLSMADGSVKTIRLARREDVLDLCCRALQNPDNAEAVAIRDSVGAVEPGGGRMMEVCRVGLLGPAKEE